MDPANVLHRFPAFDLEDDQVLTDRGCLSQTELQRSTLWGAVKWKMLRGRSVLTRHGVCVMLPTAAWSRRSVPRLWDGAVFVAWALSLHRHGIGLSQWGLETGFSVLVRTMLSHRPR